MSVFFFRSSHAVTAGLLLAALSAGAPAAMAPVETAQPVCVRNCPPGTTRPSATGAATADGSAAKGESWGAIATAPRSYAFSYNHASRPEAERAARAQCDQRAGENGACQVHAFFSNACGALARGNFGEWAVAVESSDTLAGDAALAQCNSHLPTEPCKVVVSVCSPH